MQYFGVPKCPYCKKRVNLIRTWSLKRQGEYQCPRCGGISNIFLSPLIYVFALLAVFAGGAVYFFHKFVLDDISLSTTVQILVPFAVFFLLSLFMVYLVKPVIKKVPKADMKKRRTSRADARGAYENRREPVYQDQMFYDDQEYLPKTDYRTGPFPQPEDDRDMKVVPSGARRGPAGEEIQKTSVVELPKLRQAQTTVKTEVPAARRSITVDPSAVSPVRSAPARSRPTVQRERPVQSQARRVPAEGIQASVPQVKPASRPVAEDAEKSASKPAEFISNEDFFAKYDDPDYVERRLRELKEDRNGHD